MPIGLGLPSELTESRRPGTGRGVWRYTCGRQHSYPLHYFTRADTAVTSTNRWQMATGAASHGSGCCRPIRPARVVVSGTTLTPS